MQQLKNPSSFEFIAVEREEPLRLRPPLVEGHKRVETYVPTQGMPEAMDVAMMLGQPLLLTGDPGTGKTRAAHWLAHRLNAGPLLRFNVKSNSSGTDLLYQFDEVGRFRDATRQEKPKPLVRYLTFNALGEAILRAAGGKAVLRTTTGVPLEAAALVQYRELLATAFGDAAPTSGAATASLLLPDDKDFAQAPSIQRVVLIDELDKAPRDTPNDLLAEVEDMRFRIGELQLVVTADPDVRPIVVITSNSEKSLPDPFLRRCAYFDIPFPRRWDAQKDGDWPGYGTLEHIVEGHIDALEGGGPLVSSALDVFERMRRETSGIRKKPATAELLAWLDLLTQRQKLTPGDNLRNHTDAALETLGAVLKCKDDLDAARRLLNEWAKPPATARGTGR